MGTANHGDYKQMVLMCNSTDLVVHGPVLSVDLSREVFIDRWYF